MKVCFTKLCSAGSKFQKKLLFYWKETLLHEKNSIIWHEVLTHQIKEHVPQVSPHPVGLGFVEASLAEHI